MQSCEKAQADGLAMDIHSNSRNLDRIKRVHRKKITFFVIAVSVITLLMKINISCACAC